MALLSTDRQVFMSTGNFERFQYFNTQTSFLKNETFFQKTGYHFLAESTKIENATFLYTKLPW